MMCGDSDNDDPDVSTAGEPPFAGFDLLESLFPPGGGDTEKAEYVLSLLQLALRSSDELWWGSES
jgi:hypothetical protein